MNWRNLIFRAAINNEGTNPRRPSRTALVQAVTRALVSQLEGMTNTALRAEDALREVVLWGDRREEVLDARAREFAAGDTTLTITAEALLTARAALAAQVARLDRLFLAQARQDPACQRLMSVPGVGAITATASVSTIDDPTRFKHSASVGAYLRLTPRRYRSGIKDVGAHLKGR